MDLVTIGKEALALPVQERAKLAQRLLESLDEVAEAEAEQLWLDVAVRRAEEIDGGNVQMARLKNLKPEYRHC